ncbi:MAG: peptidase inhibitor family I36 protein [Nakamurella sp.]
MIERIKSLRLAAVAAVVAMAAATLVGLTASASAAEPDKPGPTEDSSTSAPAKPGGKANKDGVCNTSELCLYYFQNRTGAKLDLLLSDANFSGDVLKGGGSGNGASANNNTRSYLSTETVYYWRVYDGANYTGTQILCIAPGDRGNFTSSLWDKATSATYSTTAC